jgi:kynurenine formamidase
MTEDEVLELFTICSNTGRWGREDELGTLNLITSEKRLAAIRSVMLGQVYSLSYDLNKDVSAKNPRPLVHNMQYVEFNSPMAALDSVAISVHGLDATHLDAIGHVNFEGEMYNNRRAEDALRADGLSFGSILAMRHGVVTRGVLLDVAATREVQWLEAGAGVTPTDLEDAEKYALCTVEPGDAVFVRVGLATRELAQGVGDPLVRAGLTPASVRWLYERDVAVFSGDCGEQMPSNYPRVPLPLHQIGLAAMGLTILDNPDVEILAETTRRVGRNYFLLVCSPLRIPGGTGSPANPLAIF